MSPLPFPHVRLDGLGDVLTAVHLHEAERRGHRHAARRAVPRPATLDAVLPPGAEVLRTYDAHDELEALVRVDDGVVLLTLGAGATTAYATHADAALARALADGLVDRVPRDATPGRVDVSFPDERSGPRLVSLAVRAWPAVREHYAAPVAAALDRLVAHVPDPEAAGRLVLWHGAPGTGKTSAVRALVDAWREWADVVVVSDPDALLRDGRYLRRVVLDEEVDDRWTLVVLEDAEALLRKETGGQAMATLLNLTDGLLGQGLRCLFLITTNEPLHALHPALTRPGRCLAQVEFVPLEASRAARLLGRPVDRPMTLAEVVSARPVQVVAEPDAVGQYL